MEHRKELLLKMYDQMFNDIDRHHKIVWQIIGILVGSFAILAIAEKGIISIDLAISIILLLSLWVMTNVYDSNYWYSRNLVIIANIERQFLEQKDLKEIHYYFGKHRAFNAIQTSLKIQLYFTWGLILIVLAYHFFSRVLPGFHLSCAESEIDWIRTLPYLTTILFYLIVIRWIRSKREQDYKEFIKNSPGKKIDTTGIEYGSGHPIDENKN